MTKIIFATALSMLIATFNTSALASPKSKNAPSKGQKSSPTLLAQKAKKKKRHRKKNPRQAPNEKISDNTQSSSDLHQNQKGKSEPYWAEVEGSADLKMLTTSNDSTSFSQNTTQLQASLLMFFGEWQAGPVLRYQTTTYDETSSSTMSFGGTGKWNFGDINRDAKVTFAGATFLIDQNDNDSNSSSGTTLEFFGGMHMFFDTNIAITPRGGYHMSNTSSDGAESSTTGFFAAVGWSIFI